MKTALAALLAAASLAASSPHFTLTASFVAPAGAGAQGAIAVTFLPLDPDVKVNQEPAPRLKLDPAQRVLLDKQKPAPARMPVFDPDTARYFDAKTSVLFPVAWVPGAPKGAQLVKGSVVYFYCSKREGWCRRGSEPIEVPVTVP